MIVTRGYGVGGSIITRGFGLLFVVLVVAHQASMLRGGSGEYDWREDEELRRIPRRIFKDDDDILELVVWMVTSGILE